MSARMRAANFLCIEDLSISFDVCGRRTGVRQNRKLKPFPNPDLQLQGLKTDFDP
jgi:hypothetical protein